MFVPSNYREPDRSWMTDLMRDNPLALAVINGTAEDGPFATHLPVIADPRANEEWAPDLSGARLLGHMNKANPHWAAMKTGGVVLLTFTGPHSYVSPTVYEKSPAAPTWDFTSVHVRGVVEKIESSEETMDVVQSTVRAFEEAKFGSGWDMTDSIGYFHQLLPAVGAFRITVTGAEGMFKLSQEQPAEVRGRVLDSFTHSGCTRQRDTADLMRQLP
ncbi:MULTISPECIES: FMN-binding negative transcriptional regulator [Streptomyces]|uniref:Transcriptional regulator n=1 Tax=Streptomyces amritsarensis TaxID=681158 RepID=A0ABX3G0F6_9ACTN|nr:MULTISPECIES: FMN-binding negative transcriptional regulator [Streptomyces]AQT74922.1 transcriptional regulator [Streptomyces sp. fd1-xmd]MDX6758959.1 FMN-binding negative transcriptional regulator [Streptomyces sp. F8]OLZ61374.1 transcriptional regulator [Streptomyces amritsarensis]